VNDDDGEHKVRVKRVVMGKLEFHVEFMNGMEVRLSMAVVT